MAIARLNRDGIVEIRIDQPPVNALDRPAVDALHDRFAELAATPPAVGVVLTGTGRTFCAGVDVRAWEGYDVADREGLFAAITRMTTAVRALPCPLVAAVNGHALGGGLVLALCCDWRVAIDDPGARLGLPEAQAGVPFPDGPLAIVRQELPAPLLRQLALSSVAVSPAQLHHWQVIDELVPVDRLTETAHARVRQLAAQPGYAAVRQQLRGAER